MKLEDIPQLTQDGHYQVNIFWDYLNDWIDMERAKVKCDLNPDFQRGHVWTEEQQRNFVEFCLRGGRGSNIIRFNCPGWMRTFKGPFVIVDGKQRLEAVRKFVAGDLKVFNGHTINDFEDKKKILMSHDFIFMVNDLPDRKSVLQWYLDINSGGVAHTSEEIERVRNLLALEK